MTFAQGNFNTVKSEAQNYCLTKRSPYDAACNAATNDKNEWTNRYNAANAILTSLTTERSRLSCYKTWGCTDNIFEDWRLERYQEAWEIADAAVAAQTLIVNRISAYEAILETDRFNVCEGDTTPFASWGYWESERQSWDSYVYMPAPDFNATYSGWALQPTYSYQKIARTACDKYTNAFYTSELASVTYTCDSASEASRRNLELCFRPECSGLSNWSTDPLSSCQTWSIFTACPTRTIVTPGSSIAAFNTTALNNYQTLVTTGYQDKWSNLKNAFSEIQWYTDNIWDIHIQAKIVQNCTIPIPGYKATIATEEGNFNTYQAGQQALTIDSYYTYWSDSRVVTSFSGLPYINQLSASSSSVFNERTVTSGEQFTLRSLQDEDYRYNDTSYQSASHPAAITSRQDYIILDSWLT